MQAGEVGQVAFGGLAQAHARCDRAQAGHDRAHRADRGVEVADGQRQLVVHGWGGAAHGGLLQGEFDPQRQQPVPKLVVQVARDAGAFGFAHAFLLPHQAAQHLMAAGEGIFDVDMRAAFGLELLLERAAAFFGGARTPLQQQRTGGAGQRNHRRRHQFRRGIAQRQGQGNGGQGGRAHCQRGKR